MTARSERLLIAAIVSLLTAVSAFPQSAAEFVAPPQSAASADTLPQLSSLPIPSAIADLLSAAVHSDIRVQRAQLGIRTASLSNALSRAKQGPVLRMTTDNPALSASYTAGSSSSPLSVELLPSVTEDFSGTTGTSFGVSVPIQLKTGQAAAASVTGTISQSISHFIGAQERTRRDEIERRSTTLAAETALTQSQTAARSDALRAVRGILQLDLTVLDLDHEMTTRSKDIDRMRGLAAAGSPTPVALQVAELNLDRASRKLDARRSELSSDEAAEASRLSIAQSALQHAIDAIPEAALKVPTVPAAAELHPASVDSAELGLETSRLDAALHRLSEIPNLSTSLSATYSGTTSVPLSLSVYISFSFETPRTRALRHEIDAIAVEDASLAVTAADQAFRQQLSDNRHRALDLTLSREDVDTDRRIAELQLQDARTRYGSGVGSESDVADATYQLNRAKLSQQIQYIDELIFAVELAGLQ